MHMTRLLLLILVAEWGPAAESLNFALVPWPSLVEDGPMALNYRAKGVSPSQPGATPQVTDHNPEKG